MANLKVLGADLNYTELFSPAPTGIRVRTHTTATPILAAEVSQLAGRLVLQPDYATLFAPHHGGRLVRLHVYKE